MTDPAPSETQPVIGRRRELIVAVLLALVLAASIAGIKWIRISDMRGDTAIFQQLLENIAQNGRAESQVFANTQWFLDRHYAVLPPKEYATNPLAPPPDDVRPMMPYHAYFILYPMALLVRAIPAQIVILGTYGLIFAGVLLAAYIELRARGVSLPSALAFCVLLAAAPAWGQAALYGQFYPDRLFLLVGLVFMLRFARSGVSRYELVTLALLCLMANERGALAAGLFAVVFTAAYWRRIAVPDRIFRLGMGAVLLGYGFVATTFFLVHTGYGTFFHGIFFMTKVMNPVLLQMTLLYVLVSLPFLIIAAFEWRALAIALLFMIPNVDGTVGGAEKIGWITHYHTYDFTPLVWAALAGFVALDRKYAASGRRAVGGAAAIVATAYLVLLDPSSYQHVRFGPAQIASTFFVLYPEQMSVDFTAGGSANRHLAELLAGAVPPASVVSTVELGMTPLYAGRTLRMFPLGIDQADYAVLNDNGAAIVPRYTGTVHFGDPAQNKAVDTTVLARMRRDGYDFEHAVDIPGLSLAVVRRVH